MRALVSALLVVALLLVPVSTLAPPDQAEGEMRWRSSVTRAAWFDRRGGGRPDRSGCSPRADAS